MFTKVSLFLMLNFLLFSSFNLNSQVVYDLSKISNYNIESETISFYREFAFENKKTVYVNNGELIGNETEADRFFIDAHSLNFFNDNLVSNNQYVKMIRFSASSSEELTLLSKFDFNLIEDFPQLKFILFLFEYQIEQNRAEQFIKNLNVDKGIDVLYHISIAN